MRINHAIRQSSHRPHSLLVLLNPFGGTRKAKEVWRDIAMPVFDLAGRCSRPGSMVTHESRADLLQHKIAPQPPPPPQMGCCECSLLNGSDAEPRNALYQHQQEARSRCCMIQSRWTVVSARQTQAAAQCASLLTVMFRLLSGLMQWWALTLLSMHSEHEC